MAGQRCSIPFKSYTEEKEARIGISEKTTYGYIGRRIINSKSKLEHEKTDPVLIIAKEIRTSHLHQRARRILQSRKGFVHDHIDLQYFNFFTYIQLREVKGLDNIALNLRVQQSKICKLYTHYLSFYYFNHNMCIICTKISCICCLLR